MIQSRKQLFDRQRLRILKALRGLGGARSTREIANQTPWAVLTVHQRLMDLAAQGKVERIGSGVALRWSPRESAL